MEGGHSSNALNNVVLQCYSKPRERNRVVCAVLILLTLMLSTVQRYAADVQWGTFTGVQPVTLLILYISVSMTSEHVGWFMGWNVWRV